MKFKSLYRKTSNGILQEWRIGASLTDATVVVQYGKHRGKMQTQVEHVTTNKSGRTLREQLISRMKSRISKQRDKGYVDTLAAAIEGRTTNALNLVRPMLAQPLKNTLLPKSLYLQYKYDGNRCLITKHNDKLIAYSRNGKLITTIDHILDVLQDLPEGVTLDGELYYHGVPLQTLRSWITRPQEMSKKLQYIYYDLVDKASYRSRLSFLKQTLGGIRGPISLAETEEIRNVEEISIPEKLQSARKLGYEGLIARCPETGYEDSKRSKALIKIKAWMDDEFQVVNIEKSADGWAVLVCEVGYDQVFRVSAPGSILEKVQIWEDRKEYLGKYVTVEYSALTKDGIPFHPVAKAFRDFYE